MTNDKRNQEALAIFCEAMEFKSPEAQADYIAQACGDNAQLKQEVEELLKSDRDAGSFLHEGEQATSLFATPNQDSVREAAGNQIGRYKLLQKIGEGGFGVVFMAEQQRPVRRKVALKIIKRGMDTKEVIARFEAERQALALMDHPNIARVLDGGETETGQPFFAMELVKGVPLTEFCDTNKLSITDRLQLFITICRAIQHAHQKGIIHRDLKPSNVMVTLHDNKPVPKIIDFGVSKAISQQLTEKTLFTAYGQMVGTPVYMSPEQAQFSGLDIDTRSDIYSLGVLLYELLTGTTPLDAQKLRATGYAEMQRLIAEEEAPTPSTRLSTLGDQSATIATHRDTDPNGLRQFLRGDLDWIVMKALDKERSRRYESASNLAEDVVRFLEDDLVEARPPSTAYKLQKFARRNRGPVIVASGLLLTLCLGLIGTTWGLLEARRQTTRVVQEQKNTLAEKSKAVAAQKAATHAGKLAVAAGIQSQQIADERRHLLYVSNMQLADQIWLSPTGNQREIDELLAAWIPVDDEHEDLRDFAWRYQWSRLHQSSRYSVFNIGAAAFSPDGHLIAGDKHGIDAWNRSGSREPERRWEGDASKARLSPNGLLAAVPTQDRHFTLINVTTGLPAAKLSGSRIAFSCNSQFVACWGAEGEIEVWDVRAEPPKPLTPLRWIPQEKLPTEKDLFLGPDGKSFLVKLGGHRVTGLVDGEEPASWFHQSPMGDCAWSHNGKMFAIGNLNGKTYLRNVSRMEQPIDFGTYGKQITALAFSEDGRQLATGGSDGTIAIWNIEQANTPRRNRSIKAHVGRVESVAFSQDGLAVVSISDGTAKRWDVEPDDGAIQLKDVGEQHFSGSVGVECEVTDEGVLVKGLVPAYPAAESGQIKIGDRIVAITDEGNPPVESIPGQNDGLIVRLLVGRPGSAVKLRLLRSNKEEVTAELQRMEGRRYASDRVAFAPDSKSLVVASRTLGTTVWNLAARRAQRIAVEGASVAISPDERFLALDDRWQVVIWDLEKNQPYQYLKTHEPETWRIPNARGSSVAFSTDSRYVAVGLGFPFNHNSKPSGLRVFDIQRRDEVKANSNQAGESRPGIHSCNSVMTAVLFTPDGKYLIGVDHNGVLGLWDTNSWALQQEHRGLGRVTAMDISRDGSTIALGFGVSLSEKSGIHIWDIASKKPVRTFRTSRPMAVAFSPNGKTIVSSGEDHEVVLWDVATGMPLQSLESHENISFGAAFSPDGSMLASTNADGIVRIWEAESFEQIDQHPETLNSLYRLGVLQNQERHYHDADATLTRLYDLQQKVLSSDDPKIAKTKAEITVALRGLGRLPTIARQPDSAQAALGDEVSFQVEISEAGPWAFQWFHNGRAIPDAVQQELKVMIEAIGDFGLYQVEVRPIGRHEVKAVRSKNASLVQRGVKFGRGLKAETFQDIRGRTVADLTNSPKFPHQPDEVDVIYQWELPSDIGDNYGVRFTGYLVPPSSGDYKLFICSDDDSELYLSSDESSDNKQPVARVKGAFRPRKWQELNPMSVSAPVHLEAGKRYWVETHFKDSMGRDNIAVTWQLPDQPPPQNGAPPISGDFLEYPVDDRSK